MDFRKHIEDDSVLAKFVKSFGTSEKLIKVIVPSDTTEYELKRISTVVDKINFFNRQTANIETQYEVVLQDVVAPEQPDVVETRKKNNERTKKTSSTD